MFEAITALGMICIAISAVYLFKNRKPKASSGNYIWVGPGEDPFKQRKG